MENFATFAGGTNEESIRNMMTKHYLDLLKSVKEYEELLNFFGIDHAEIKRNYANQINGTYGSIAEQFNAGKSGDAVDIANGILLDGRRNDEESKRNMMMQHYLGLLESVKEYEELLNFFGINPNEIISNYANQINGTYGSIAGQFDGDAVDIAKRTFR